MRTILPNIPISLQLDFTITSITNDTNFSLDRANDQHTHFWC